MTFNLLKTSALGYEENDLPDTVGYEFFTDKLHPEDYLMVMQSMENVLKGLSLVYEVEYRIKSKNGVWKWYYDRGAVTKLAMDGKPLIISGIVFDISHQKEIEEKLLLQNKALEEMAAIDGLTGLFNHKVIFDKLTVEINRAKRYNKKLTVCMLVIDNFKMINDAYGHLIGDDVIMMVADKIQKNIRNTDIAGRYGGEEYVVVFPETGLQSAFSVANRIRKDVEEAVLEQGIRATISGGISEFCGQSENELIYEADSRMLIAKKSGKNKILVN